MDKKYQVVALIGKAGAGKDTVQKVTCNNHPLMFNKIVSCTTRPMREGEVDGVDYHFISLEEFTRNVLGGKMLEATEFRSWFYGTLESSLVTDKINIGVFNPDGVEALLEDPRLDVTVFEIIARDKTRLLRYLNREEDPDCAEMCRRYFTDEKDFFALDFEHIKVENEDGYSLDLVAEGRSSYKIFEKKWRALGLDTEFETILRWESSKVVQSESDKIEDNNE